MRTSRQDPHITKTYDTASSSSKLRAASLNSINFRSFSARSDWVKDGDVSTKDVKESIPNIEFEVRLWWYPDVNESFAEIVGLIWGVKVCSDKSHEKVDALPSTRLDGLLGISGGNISKSLEVCGTRGVTVVGICVKSVGNCKQWSTYHKLFALSCRQGMVFITLIGKCVERVTWKPRFKRVELKFKQLRFHW